MKVAGSFRFAAPRDDVFRAVCDPGVLMEIIPGCSGVERAVDGEYRGEISLRLPGAVGRYRTTVRLVDAVPPERSGITGTVEGPMGSISGSAAFVLRDGLPGTVMDYQGSGVVLGPLARLDARFAERLAESLIGQGLRALDARLVRAGAPDDRSGMPHAATEGSE